MKIQPYLVGSGRAGLALLKSLALLEMTDSEFEIQKFIKIDRNRSLKNVKQKDDEFSLLLIANPHGLHAEKLLEAETENFDLIISEKPICTTLSEVSKLKELKTPLAVCHGYRQSWGVQKLKSMIDAGAFGEIISIEGRYWQSSTAQRVLENKAAQSWKNDPKLSGPYDVLLDIGTHWVDTAIFLLRNKPIETKLWLSYVNAEAKHRDSHVHLSMNFENGTHALASISKTVHGATNHFEVNIIGAKKFATWKFLDADRIEIGEGNSTTYLSRSDSELGSKQGPYHATGWLEGYIEIIRQSLLHTTGKKFQAYPDLNDSIRVMETLLNAQHL